MNKSPKNLLRHLLGIASAARLSAAGTERRDETGTRLPSSRLSWRSPFLALVVVGLWLAVIWAIVYLEAKRSMTHTANENLAAVATLKVNQIEQWLQERKIDAQILSHAPQFSDTLEAWLKGGRRNDTQRDVLLHYMRELAEAAHYRDITIRSADDGALLLSSGGDLMDTQEIREQAMVAAVQPGVEDLHFTYPGSPDLDVGFFAPITAGTLSQPRAILHITLDPAEWLFPLVDRWPGASPSAESLLVRIEGNELVYLNHLRHQRDSALRLRVPVNTPRLLAAQAASGTGGTLEGVDYRGVPALGNALPIAGTPWRLIAKIDTAEVYGELNRLAAFSAIVAILLLLAGAWWFADRSRLALESYRERLERTLLSKRIDFLAKYANDSILLIDPHGRIIEVNDRALATYGYTHGEMVGMDVAQIRSPHTAGDAHQQLANLPEDRGLIYETEHRCKDGRTFPVEVSIRLIDVSGEICVQEIVRDISVRLTAERALRASETRFRQLFDLAPTGTATVTLDGRLDTANAALVHLVGHASAQLRTMSLADLTHPADLRTQTELGDRLAAGAMSRFTVEKRLVHADGHVIWAIQDATLVRDADGAPLHLIVQFIDVSERKAFIARIERLSRLYAAISGTNHAIVHSATPQQVYRAVCRACVELGGLPLAWIGIADAGRSRILPVESAGEAAGFLDDIVIATGADRPEGCGPTGIAYREQRIYSCPDYMADAHTRPWHGRAAQHGIASTISLPLLRGGLPYGTLTVYGREKDYFDAESIQILREMAANISFALDHFDRDEQRRQDAEKLALYADEIEDLYQNAPCGYHSLDGNGLVLRINDTELSWLGYRREEVVGRLRLPDLMTAESSRRFDENFARFKASGAISDREADFVRKDGTVLPVLINGTAVKDAEGNFVCSRTTVYDITERRKIERERAAHAARMSELSHRLVAVQEAERRALAEALHDRSSPNLAAIAIMLGTVGRSLPAETSADAQAAIEDAQALLKDTASDIREIVANLRPSVLDYAGLLPSLSSYAKQFSRRTGVPVRVVAEGDDTRLATETESLLFRIAQEALTNCAKHAYAKSIEINLARRDGEVVLTVSDDGFGFTPERLGDSGHAPGLGLITMRERAEFAGGVFSITSWPGQGTTVTVRLDDDPAPPADASPRFGVAEPPQHTGREAGIAAA